MLLQSPAELVMLLNFLMNCIAMMMLTTTPQYNWAYCSHLQHKHGKVVAWGHRCNAQSMLSLSFR